MAGSGFTVGDWCWFTRQASPCRVIERQDVWGEVAYRVWLPARRRVTLQLTGTGDGDLSRHIEPT